MSVTATDRLKAVQAVLQVDTDGKPNKETHDAFDSLCLAAAHESEPDAQIRPAIFDPEHYPEDAAVADGLRFVATKARVLTRGTPPDSFLRELVQWARNAPDEIFTLNDRNDIYTSVAGKLGPYASLLHRKAVMLEVLRVLAGFESSWNWNEGVDTTNHHSLTHLEGQETGIFQVSADSMAFSPELRKCVERHSGTSDVPTFIRAMKENHALALEYCARLLRISYAWDGPIKREEVHPYLSRQAVAEFQGFLSV